MANSAQNPDQTESEKDLDNIIDAQTDGESTSHEEPSGVSDSVANGSEQNTSGDAGSDLAVELLAAREEASKFKDVALRAEAEMENVRRRATRDVENAHKFGQEKLIQNLLPVVDSLEKAIEAAEQVGAEDAASKAILEGVGLCLKMQLDVLTKQGLVCIDPHGEPFDPNKHQAISMVENPDVEPNSVVTVIQKGYTLNDRLVRPAMVMVSKASAAEPGAGVDETV